MLRRNVMYCSQLIMPDVVQQDYVSYPTLDIQIGKHYLTGRDDVLLPFEALRVTRDGFIIDDESQKVLWKPKKKKSALNDFYYQKRNTRLNPLKIYLDCFVRNKYDYDHVAFLDDDYTHLNVDNLCFYALNNHNANCGTGFMEIEGYNNFIIDIKPEHFSDTQPEEVRTLSEIPGILIHTSGLITDLSGVDVRKVNSAGYLVVYRNGTKYLAHRLVASAFLLNPLGYEIVNHINGDKTDNRVANLEWVNNSLNIIHGSLLRNRWNAIGAGSSCISVKPYLNISITSHKLIEFVKERILVEKMLPPEYWLFSNAEPFRALFLILIRHKIMKSKILPDFIERSAVYKSLNFKGRLSLLNDLSNRHAARKSEADHIASILSELKIDLREYLHWIIFDLKNLIDDDAGFLYAEELLLYKSIMSANNRGQIYLNTILEFTTIKEANSKYIDKFQDIIIPDNQGDVKMKVFIPSADSKRLRTLRLVEELEDKFEPRSVMKSTNSQKKSLNSNFKHWYLHYTDWG